MAHRPSRSGHPGRAHLHPALACRPTDNRRDQIIYDQHRHDRARRTLRGIDTQVAKAEKAVDDQAPVERNRFISLSGGTRKVNRTLEAKARALAGIKGYITNLDGATAQFVIDAYQRLSRSRRVSGCPSTTCRRSRSTPTHGKHT
jgi:hypothetical protein